MDIIKALTVEFKLKAEQVKNTVTLLDEGNTVPFIARYRKELTGSLDDQIIRELADRLTYLRNLDEKREQVRKLIDEQGNLTDEISKGLDDAKTMTEIDDIYRPFRPKRRTRATIAKEKGLQGLADVIWLQVLDKSLDEHIALYIDAEKGVETAEDALQGAMDIIAENISDDAEIRKMLREHTFNNGDIVVCAEDTEKESVYEMYYDYIEKIKSIASHRVLAINRGEKEEFLKVRLTVDEDKQKEMIENKVIIKNSATKDILIDTVADSYKRLIFPSIEREIRGVLTETSEESAIKVFSENLKQLLLQAPIKDKTVLALDPGFRTGCKVAVVGHTGEVLDTDIIYPTHQNRIEEGKNKLKKLIDKHNVDIVAIGNGTASRETELFTASMIKEIKKPLSYIIVNEAGASVYSASKLGAEEFPQFDVSLRSAVSIGRRLQDPLAELVKIDPKSIGVGQYQHDMNQKRLEGSLGGVVESAVNSVGVDLNTASPSLLSYVAGISGALSKNIIAFREENGKFKNRKQLLKVAKLGPKAYEQCAGFLRISESDNVLDMTGVHPESYDVAEKVLSITGFKKDDVKEGKIKNLSQKIPSVAELAEKVGVGEETLKDIIKELEKPGRDPREDMPTPILRNDVLSMEDLKEGMILMGTVRNLVDFGAFVDIGVHQDGLVHISQICNKYIKHPLEYLSVSDIVKVKVLSVDINKKRISLTMKGIEE